MKTVSATVLADPSWLREDLKTAARMYGASSGARVLGTVRWYSASSVLVAPAVESLLAGAPLDPSLEAMQLDMHDDGRYVESRSLRVLGGDVVEAGNAMAAALAEAIGPIGEACGAAEPALWAIAADSIANRLLWAGQARGEIDDAMKLAAELAEAIGPRLPMPRFVTVGDNWIVRRSSCCLIYEIPNGQKCASCPRQTPAERTARLRPYS